MYQGNKQYQRFFLAYSKCHPQISQATNQAKANELWSTIKKNGVINVDLYQTMINDFEAKAKEKKEKGGIKHFVRR